jgi:chromosome segregation ATPase
MEFFRRASKTASDITPPIVMIEELKTEIADLKDELESATQAKKFATDTLKAHLEANAKTEQELSQVRAELLELLARQQAEIPVMAAPSPNGSNRIRLELEEGQVQLVSIGEGESLIKQLSERVVELETQANQQKEEIESLKKINKENLVKLRNLLAEKTQPDEQPEDLLKELEATRAELEIAQQLVVQMGGLEQELEARNERIQELERTIIQAGTEIDRIQAAAKQSEEEMARTAAENDVLRMRMGELETEIVQIKGELDVHEADKRREAEIQAGLVSSVAKLEREVHEKSVLIDTLRNDLATASECNSGEVEKLRESVGEYEEQILQLINQVAELKNEKKDAHEQAENSTKELIQARKDADEASRRLEAVMPKIDEIQRALAKAVQTALEARKECWAWKTKYETDLGIANERLKQIAASNRYPPIKRVDLLN